MPDIQTLTMLPWGQAAALQALTVLPWGQAAPVQTLGQGYAFPSAPPGGEVVAPGDLRAPVALDAAATYDQTHTLEVRDLRTDALLPVASVALGLDDGSIYWTLQASGEGTLFDTLTTGQQPASVQVSIDGLVWAFVVESVTRPRAFASDRVSFSGRSTACVADGPYQFEASYVNTEPTSAAQLAASALQMAGVALRWEMADWLLPAGSVSLTGTPMDVVRAVAAAVGAVVTAHASELQVTVQSRYPSLPNEWAYQVPDVQVHSRAVRAETFERADRPGYTGVLVAGQTGQLAYIRLEGTSGADQAPMVTDPLLTDAVALRERGRAVLGAGGQQARVSQTLPVRVGAGEPGVLSRGWLMRFLEQPATAASVAGIWHGVVRSVQVQAALPVVQQSIGIERHTGHVVSPDTSPILDLAAPISTQTAFVGVPFTLDLTGSVTGGLPPLMWQMRAGVLPAGLALAGTTGVIEGVPQQASAPQLIQVRATDSVARMREPAPFLLDVVYPGDVVLLAHMDGADGAISFVDSSSYGRTLTRTGTPVITSAWSKFGGTSLRGPNSTGWDVRAASSSELLMGARDFVIDLWMRPDSLPAAGQFWGLLARRSSFSSNNEFALHIDGDQGGRVSLAASPTGTSAGFFLAVGPAQAATVGADNHVRAVRKGEWLAVALNGVFGAPVFVGTAAMFASTAPLCIGRTSSGVSGNCLPGYIDEVFYMLGAAWEIEDFTPPPSAWADPS